MRFPVPQVVLGINSRARRCGTEEHDKWACWAGIRLGDFSNLNNAVILSMRLLLPVLVTSELSHPREEKGEIRRLG